MGVIFNKRVKYACFFIELLLLYIIQNATGIIPEIFTAKPMLVMAAVITFSLIEDEVPAMILGLVGGLFIDLSFGMHFGLFSIIMAVLACFISVFVKSKINITLVSSIFIGAFFLIISITCDWYFRYELQGFSHSFLMIVDFYLPVYIYTCLCLPMLYVLNLGIFNALRFKEPLQ